jgi:multiple sugar transport system permease protein
MSVDLELAQAAAKYKNKQKVKDRFISAFIGVFAIVWIFPIAWTIWTSLRPYKDVRSNGLFSIPKTLNLDNYTEAISRMDLPLYFWNTALITVPAVFLTLFFGSLIAFVVSRYSFKWNVSLLLLFTAGNLLPAQLVFIPVFKMYVTLGKAVGMPRLLYDSPWGVVLIHVAFQMGFATFVLSSYMKTVPKEISESAMVDGASVFTHYTKVMLPLLRPALASLGCTYDNLDLQRFLLGACAHVLRFKTTDHFRPRSTAGRICNGLQPLGSWRHNRRLADPHCLLLIT